jgi:diguanylate cyclase (GGDEF)-like protein
MPRSGFFDTQIQQPIGDSTGSDPLATGELGLITRSATLATGAQTGLVVLSNPTAGVVDVLCAWRAARAPLRLPPSPAADGFIDRVLANGHATVEPMDPHERSLLATLASGTRLTYAAGVEISPPGGPSGALCVGLESPPRDPDLTIWKLDSYARLASLCLHDPSVLDGLLAPARVDGLTGCLNHTALRSELDREIARATRYGRVLSCCFIDLDRFKTLNDRYGHIRGNRVLASVAAVLRHQMRQGDTLGRFGGDEFVALLADADEDSACVLAERLRVAIRASRFDGCAEQLDASIGVAQWQPGWTAEGTLEAADQALAHAKRAGGGIVYCAGSAST